MDDILKEPMDRVDKIILQNLTSDIALISQIGNYIINNGGKRLRPKLVLLSAMLADYDGDRHYQLAAIIEFIHTATLLHDDVVDESKKRRGYDTSNQIWGNSAAVLVGDFLYSRAFEMMVVVDDMQVMNILAKTTNTIAEGEVMQLLNINNSNITVEQYIKTIQTKTAILFESSLRLGALTAGLDQAQQNNLAKFGSYLGCAFQLIDDILDYDINNKKIGKNIGDDLAEGKPTLPIIYALEVADKSSKKIITEAIKKGSLKYLDDILQILKTTNSLQRCYTYAEEQIDKALGFLAGFANSKYKTALIAMAEKSISRKF
jgi:octaprenyl-diphosphate synthase